MFINDIFGDNNKKLDEVSNELLGRYKKAAGADASAADKRGDVEQGNKRFKGIVKATIKQGDNDAKRHKTQGMAEGSMIDDLLDVPGKVVRKAQDAARGMPPGTVPDSQDDLVNTATKFGKQVIDTATDAARGMPTGTVPKPQKDKDVKEQTGNAPTQAQVNKLDAAGNQISQAKQDIEAGNNVKGAFNAARGINQALDAGGATLGDKASLAWTGLKAAGSAGLAYMQGKNPQAAAADSVANSIVGPLSGVDTKQAAATAQQYRGPNAKDITKDPQFAKLPLAKQQQVTQAQQQIRDMGDDDFANVQNFDAKQTAANLASAMKEEQVQQYNPKGVPIKTAQAAPAPLNVPQGWEAKTQADGSTRISKQGSIPSDVYKQNIADYKAQNWTPEKMNDYGQRMASGQGYTAAEKAANYQQQQKSFGQYADTPLDEQGVAEGLPQTLRKVVPGYAKREIDKKMDAEKFGRTDVDRDANYYRYKKIQDKIKEQGVAEGKKPDNYHIVNKDGKPASLASYADRASAVKDRDAKHPGAEVRQVGPRGKVKGVSESGLNRSSDHRKLGQELAHETNNIEISINGRVWKIFAGKGPDSSKEFFQQKQAVDSMCKRKTAETGKKWSWGVTGAAATNEGTKCNMTEQGRACPDHGIMECPGYSRLMGEAFKMPPESVQDKLHKRHQELRKKSGLPDPEHYLKLKKQKEQELVALRAEIAADKERGLTEERYLEELQRAGYDVITEKKIRQRLDPSCWKGYKKQGTKIKGGVRVNNCVPKE